MTRKWSFAFALIIILLLSLGAVCLPEHLPATEAAQLEVPKSTVLISDLRGINPSMKLYYGDVSSAILNGFDLHGDIFSPDHESYNACLNTLIPTAQYNAILQAISGCRLSTGLAAISSFDHYIAYDGYGFVTLSEGIDAFYIVDLSNYEVTPCKTEDFGSTEVLYHITSSESGYYILTYEQTHHTTCLYTLDVDSGVLTPYRHIVPPASFKAQDQCALDSFGNVYFASSSEVLVVASDGPHHLPLAFNPDKILFEDNKLFAVSFSDLFMNYTVFDDQFRTLASGQANLPNKKVSLTKAFMKDQYLYTICQDDCHPVYRHYITLYDINTREIIYCLAIKMDKDTVLLDSCLQ